MNALADELPALAWLRCALADFYIHDRTLLRDQVGEWAVTFRLGHHLALHADAAWDVDAEYDREGKDGAQKVRDDVAETHMRPDLVVHRRGLGGPSNNLLFVEAKRICKPVTGDPDDIDKVRRAVIQHEYQIAVALGMRLEHSDRFSPIWTVYALSPTPQHGTFRKAMPVAEAEAVFDDAALAHLEVAASHAEWMRQLRTSTRP